MANTPGYIHYFHISSAAAIRHSQAGGIQAGESSPSGSGEGDIPSSFTI